MKRVIILSLLAAAAIVPLRGQDTLRLELTDAIRIAVDGSIEAQMAENRLRSAYWSWRTYRREMLPELSLNATLPDYSKSMDLHQNDDGTYKYVSSNSNRFNGGLSLTQNIPWTGGTISMSTDHERLRQYGDNPLTRYKTSPVAISFNQPLSGFNPLRWMQKIEPLRYQAAMKQAVVDREEIALTVINLYFGLLSEEINLEITRQNMDNAQRLYTIAEARNRMGLIPDVELMQMRSSLLRAEIALTDGQFSLENRMFELRSYLGLGDRVTIVPTIPEFPADEIPSFDYDKVLALSRENNPFTENIRRRLIEADRNVKQAKADRRNVSLFASFGMSGQGEDLGAVYRHDRWEQNQTVRAGVRIPILDWGKGKGRVRMAEADRKIVQAQVERGNIDFAQDVYLKVQNFNNQPRQLELAGYMDEIARQRYETSVELYVLEKIDIMSLNDAQQAKDSARRSYIDEISLLWTYYYQIRALTGYDFVAGRTLEAEYDYKR